MGVFTDRRIVLDCNGVDPILFDKGGVEDPTFKAKDSKNKSETKAKDQFRRYGWGEGVPPPFQFTQKRLWNIT